MKKKSNLLVHKVDYHDQLMFVKMVKSVIVLHRFLFLTKYLKKKKFLFKKNQ